jgi:hypothetical protein
MLRSISRGYATRIILVEAAMATRRSGREQEIAGKVCRHSFGRNLQARRAISVKLPEFLIYALEQRVMEANDGASSEEASTLNHFIESELANLITVRDVAELEATTPGFGAAIQHWLEEIAT